MKKLINMVAKTFATLNLIVAVATGKGVEAAVVGFNSAWN